MGKNNINILLPALACQAVGDALGDKFEFSHGIKKEEVTRHIKAKTAIQITDDTQMTYFGMRAMAMILKNKAATTDERTLLILTEYIDWYSTQISDGHARGGRIPNELYKRRCPGIATIRSLQQLYSTNRRDKNTARGCGSVMRLLPFVVGILPDEEALQLAVSSGLVTHDHAESTVAVTRFFSIARQFATYGSEGLDAVKESYHSVVSKKNIDELGGGFYALECVNMALWAVANSATYEDLLLQSIAQDGDSDSVAAVAGCLWGLLYKQMPPPVLLNRIEEWPILKEQAEKLISWTLAAQN